MKKQLAIGSIILFLFSFGCNKNKETKSTNKKTDSIALEAKKTARPMPKTHSFYMVNAQKWLSENQLNTHQLELAYALNRTDAANLKSMDSIVLPTDTSKDIAYYMPFPLEVSGLKKIKKILFFSYPTQTFAAYQNGHLVCTGPTNMGRKKDKTPTGLFFTNWKAKQTTSTFNDEWDLKWNFNIENKLGVGFHQYSLPGYPASHSCLRLQEKDAKYLYQWAEQWELSDPETVKLKGTPVLVFGNYDFEAPKPWLKLVQDPKALHISEQELEKITQPFKETILKEQQKRVSFYAAKQQH